ncbi:MAG: stage II sporulation protein R [Oscillospiraceae bacterium]|nr:stage II sporulation protein R [Oscillospiraceae bacterium]
MKIKILDLALLSSLIICFLLSVISFEDTCGEIRGQVLRLHVIANSDSAYDQSLKLSVRDALLEKSDEFFGRECDLAAAERRAGEALPALRETAEEVLRSQGCEDPVTVTLGESYFPTRVYESVTLPAGYYKAVKVNIGSSQGHNWWCVMFPQMCLPAAQKKQKDILAQTFDEEELALVEESPSYEVRFWIVEKYWEIRDRLKNP